jgi:hypothetical protein
MPTAAAAHPCLETLDRTVVQDLVWDTYDTIAPPGEDSDEHQARRNRAALAMIESLQPRTPLEAMLGAHIVASHHATMGCYRWAMAADPTGPAAARLRQNAASLTRMLHSTILLLERCQQAGEAQRTAPPAARAAAGADPATAATPPQRQLPMPSEPPRAPTHAPPGGAAAAATPEAAPTPPTASPPQTARAPALPPPPQPASPGADIAASADPPPPRQTAPPPAGTAAAPDTSPQQEHPMSSDGDPGATAAGAATAIDPIATTRRDRRQTVCAAPGGTGPDLAALAARDPAELTDDELDMLGRAAATPEHPYDDSWRHPVRPQRAPRPETLTMAERRALYGYVVPAEFADAIATADEDPGSAASPAGR